VVTEGFCRLTLCSKMSASAIQILLKHHGALMLYRGMDDHSGVVRSCRSVSDRAGRLLITRARRYWRVSTLFGRVVVDS